MSLLCWQLYSFSAFSLKIKIANELGTEADHIVEPGENSCDIWWSCVDFEPLRYKWELWRKSNKDGKTAECEASLRFLTPNQDRI